MRTLVTGGAGFIGSHVDSLLDHGHEVSVVDDLSTGRRENLRPGVVLREADVVDAVATQALFESEQPGVVIHMAAQIGVRRSIEDPADDVLINVARTATILEAARAAGARRFVLASTGGGLYGEVTTLPTPEDAPIAPM